jgi:hypothetical protein
MTVIRIGKLPQKILTASPKARSTPPKAYAPPSGSALVIDGKAGADEWKNAYKIFLNSNLAGTAGAAQKTEVLLMHDKDNIYIAFKCFERTVNKIKTQKRGHDGDFWADDSVELFFAPQGTNTYFHFGVNASGSTYDGNKKNNGWNSGFKAAVQKGKESWSAELGIPVQKLGGSISNTWKVNFHRNRYTSGSLQEIAWSPTFSGNSHVPDRFGSLIFSKPLIQKSEKGQKAFTQQSKTIYQCGNGEGVAVFNLEAIPKNTKIVRAHLFMYRSAVVTGAMKEALVDIEVYPLFKGFKKGDTPKPEGKQLALVSPWFDRFDAAEAVQKWVKGKPNGGFFVKTCPLWNSEATILEVAYEGKPGQVPAQVSGINVFHRAGQTFITWKEVNPPITKEKITWGEFKKIRDKTKNTSTYRIYSYSKPISARNIYKADLIGEAKSLSAYNANGRNVEYLIGQAMIKSDEIGELAKNYNSYMKTWHMNHPRMDRYPLDRFVINEKEGQIPVGTGLYVHNPTKPGKTYYAVVHCMRGEENTKDISKANSIQQSVDETVGAGIPVCQGNGLWGPFFDYPGKRKNYIQWCAPPFSPKPNMYFNWSVLFPLGLKDGEKVTAEMYFHPGGRSYAQPAKKLLNKSIQIAPHDYPSSSWYGYNDALGTLKSFKKGIVNNHTQKRINAFLEWAVTCMPIDPGRIIATGGDGAAALAINFPETFAYVNITGFTKKGGILDPKNAGKFAAIWGPKSPDIKDIQGLANWEWAMLDCMVDRQTKDLPLFACLGASWGVIKGYARGQGLFYKAMARNHQPLIAGWGWSGHRNLGATDWYTGKWRGMLIKRNMPVIAISNSSTDSDRESSGHTGGASFGWKNLKDETDSFSVTLTGRACTFDFTPRRLKNFKPAPNDKVSWKTVSLPDRRGKGGGQENAGGVVVGKNGVITISNMTMAGSGFTLTLTKMSAEKLDVDKTEVVQAAPARDITEIKLKLRNWSNKPRKWTAKADVAWIKAAAASGSAKSFEDLIVRLDTKTLEPAKDHTGTLTITDVGAGTDYPVKITAKVGQVFEAPTHYVVNVTAGGESAQPMEVKNLTGESAVLTGSSTLAWITADKTEIKAKTSAPFTVKAAGKGLSLGKYEGTLTVKTNGGTQDIKLTAYVLPEYKEPQLPKGETVWLSHKMLKPVAITAHTIGGSSDKRSLQKISRTFIDKKTTKKSLLTVEKVTYNHLWYVKPAHETVFNIEGAGFKAFSAEAAMKLDNFNRASPEKFCFEIYVDNKLKAATGIIKADQLPKKLVVTGLEHAKEIRFVSRRDSGENSRHQMIWGNPRFYK